MQELPASSSRSSVSLPRPALWCPILWYRATICQSKLPPLLDCGDNCFKCYQGQVQEAEKFACTSLERDSFLLFISPLPPWEIVMPIGTEFESNNLTIREILERTRGHSLRCHIITIPDRIEVRAERSADPCRFGER